MFFSKPKLFIYRKRGVLEIYQEKNASPLAKIDIPKDVEKNEEILSSAKFKNIVNSSLEKYALKGQKVIILLSGEIIFQKTIPKSDIESQDQQIQTFLDDVPFDSQKIAQKQIETQDGLLLVATNRDLFDPIVKSLDILGASTQLVLPSSLFTSEKEVTQELFLNIKKNSDLVKRSNLLTQEKKIGKTETKKAPLNSQKRQKILALIATTLIIVGISGIIYYLLTQFVLKKPKFAPTQNLPQTSIIQDKEATDTPPMSQTQENTPSP